MWIVLSFLSAFFLATSDAFLKKGLRKDNILTMTFMRFVFSLPVLYLALPFIKVPPLDPIFYLVVVAGIPLEIVAILLYVRAIQTSDLSLTLPMLSLTPVFLILVSWILLGEKVSLQGATGVVLVATGAYVMNISASKKGLFYPFKVLFKDKGVQFMIIVASIYSLTSTLGKIGIIHSSVLFFPVIYFTFVTVGFIPILLQKRPCQAESILKDIKGSVMPGLFFGLMIVSHMFAISMANVAYMIALKRTSIIFGSIYGFVVFKEGSIKERLTGSIIMFIGVFLVSTSKS